MTAPQLQTLGLLCLAALMASQAIRSLLEPPCWRGPARVIWTRAAAGSVETGFSVLR